MTAGRLQRRNRHITLAAQSPFCFSITIYTHGIPAFVLGVSRKSFLFGVQTGLKMLFDIVQQGFGKCIYF